SEGSDRAVDQARVLGMERLPAEPVALHHAGSEVLDQHVGAARQPSHQRDAGLLPDVDGDPALVAVQALEVEPPDLRRKAAGAIGVPDAVAPARLLDLDHVRAEIAEQRRAPGTGGLVTQVDHADAGKRAGSVLPFVHATPAVPTARSAVNSRAPRVAA